MDSIPTPGLTTTTTADQDQDHLDQENFEASFPDRPDVQHKGLMEENLRLFHAIRQPNTLSHLTNIFSSSTRGQGPVCV